MRNSPPVNVHVEVGFVLAKRPEAMCTAAEDNRHAVDHGLFEVAEAEARLLFPVKVAKQIKVEFLTLLVNSEEKRLNR